MVIIDEKLEAIAHIHMAIDNDVQAHQIASESEAGKSVANGPGEFDLQQWKFGSPEGKEVNF